MNKKNLALFMAELYKREFTVKDLIKNVENDTDLGRKIVKVHMKMLRVLGGRDA